MKKVLIVMTNVPSYGDSNAATGLWLGEVTEFVEELEKVGIEVDYTSPKGGYIPIDPRSLKYVDNTIMNYYRSSDFIERALTNSLPANAVDADAYDAIYYSGGHGVMWDFPNNPYLQRISERIYQNGGYITSVCHGIAGLFYLQDEQKQPLIAGRNITGFTNGEELLSGKVNQVPFSNERLAKEKGANFEKKRPYKPFAIQDGQFITGQNPFSPRQVAELLIKNLR
ncbi:type 1 glutamine amidotransferase domain-containing protein [Weissella viridescens]|uniref:type 1 glutamine amidotransferase domain-containing protein n=1 Tax=Weissella viridescens TaxID=1629 RepID=UPI001D07AD3A|nr:type 1 glutamine amidotransferase domain-containing protein [Weissella viridescens]MCB6839496.1 type 1 glutamine amidotransferase domain-containing protein [Weissella viridescens]MCB6846227.1 type 1 glutamine amidotransferase domain-containing protein [Weissella viridescens]